ncbi:MarC family protein [uncultured Cohaesibacter sp.]|uniref:MarC family protein n=1 Tax=uncultured Cohaesibacter sp. TaxID=1002546 RepID=UPI002A0A5C73|nr:MarC family protein [uncultured Cohaesibacter sp.]
MAMDLDYPHLISIFVSFFAVVDPIGTIPVFMAVTTGMDGRARRLVIIKACAVAAAILCFFVIAGEVILTSLGIPLPAFQISGAIVLFLFALTMIFGPGKPETELELKNAHDLAVYPLAIPSIASPGAMLAAVLLTENSKFPIAQQIITTGLMISVILITAVLLLVASYAQKVIGRNGASIISRVMGMLLAAVAMENALSGLKVYFGI